LLPISKLAAWLVRLEFPDAASVPVRLLSRAIVIFPPLVAKEALHVKLVLPSDAPRTKPPKAFNVPSNPKPLSDVPSVHRAAKPPTVSSLGSATAAVMLAIEMFDAFSFEDREAMIFMAVGNLFALCGSAKKLR